ncbi:MAG: sulfite exporter TauE/SafE family protein [Deltaproteobacteria bacterium]|nr:sulfite exporter TauE/SafE family protein [Deltaproteobacteria bacterium]
MDFTHALLYILTGLLAGLLSGLIGIGGGVIIIPILILVFGLSQKAAQGTTLALLVPPIGLLAAWTYYKEGYINFPIAGLIGAGFVLGGLAGAKLAIRISDPVLEKIFGVALLIIALKMIFSK